MTTSDTTRNGRQIDSAAPFSGNPKMLAEHADATRKDDAEAARLDRWEPYRFALTTLDVIDDRWARKLAADMVDANAKRDPSKSSPVLMFSGRQAAKAGATDAQLQTLVPLEPVEIAELREEAAAVREACRIRVRERARVLAARDAAVVPPHPRSLSDLLDEPDEAASWRVDGLWPTGGRILLAAQYKSGKTTLAGDTIKTLVDGGQLLGRFDVDPVGKVALIDTELDPRTMRRWFRDKGIENADAVVVLTLRGAVSSFDILDPAIRSQWATRLAGTDVVILDCLRPLIDALGLSEDKDAGKVLTAFDALLAEVGAGEGMVVTHMGHNNERARGDSRLLDWNDAMWKIVRGGDETDDDNGRPRFFSALGRDVAVAEGRLDYDTATRHLVYEGGSRRESSQREAVPALLAMVGAEPGQSKRAAERRLIDDCGLTQRAARAAIAAALKDGSLTVTTGARNAQRLTLGGTAPAPPADPYLTASEEPK